jgi:hypothetical protein
MPQEEHLKQLCIQLKCFNSDTYEEIPFISAATTGTYAINMGTTPAPLPHNTSTTPRRRRTLKEGGRGKEACKMQKEEEAVLFITD